MKWSDYQQAIFEDVATGSGHAIVMARAGSGKTSTILEALSHVPAGKTAIVMAFNKKIADNIRPRAPAGVVVQTVSSYGHRINADVGLQFDENYKKRKWGLFSDVLKEELSRDLRSDELAPYVKLYEMSRHYLASTPEAVSDVITTCSIDVPLWNRAAIVATVVKVLESSKNPGGGYGFDEQWWFPIVNDYPSPKFDFVFIDETQDLSIAKVELALRACKPEGRIIAVGDDRQAIYGFAGADFMAMGRMKDRLQSRVLPLSVCYRCPVSVVRLAKEIVPDLEWSPDAKNGSVIEIGEKEIAVLAKPGDVVIARTNAAIAKQFFRFLGSQQKVVIQGRDFSTEFVGLIDRSKCTTIPTLVAWVTKWQEKEVAKCMAETPPRDISKVQDVASCLLMFCEHAKSVTWLKDRIKSLCTSDEADNSDAITLSTCHKAKGLEWNKVFMLRDTFMKSRPNKDGEWADPSIEEANLLYVATTRAKSALYLARSEKT